MLEGGGDTTYENVTAREKVGNDDAWRSDVTTTNASTGARMGNSTTWTRVTDGALMKLAFTSPQGDVTTTYDPPCAELRWPLTAGASWQVSCPSNSSFQGSPTLSTLVENVTVSAGTSIQTPAGTFDTIRVVIESPDTPPFTSFYAANACTHVRAQSGDIVTLLTSQRCSGAPPAPTGSPATLTSSASSPTPTDAGAQKPAPTLPIAIGLAALALLAIAKERS